MLTIRKRGRYWFARGTVPSRQANGEIVNVRIERSTRTKSKVRAREIAADYDRYYHDLAYKPQQRRGPTFAEAAITYIQTRGKSDRFVTKLIKHFKETAIADIDQASATMAAETLYPGASAASKNRGVFTPLSAIGVRGLRRPSGHASTKPIRIPIDAWFNATLPVSPPKLAALLLFLSISGRRLGEALKLTQIEEDGFVTIHGTKTGTTERVRVPQVCIDLLNETDYYRRKGIGQPSQYLFGYATVQSAHRALDRVCERAGVEKFGFHSIGRHSFATRWLKKGKTLKWIQEAAGWASIKMPADRYAHLEKSDVRDEATRGGQDWGSKRVKARKRGKTGLK